LNAEYESVITFEVCKIITPSIRFYESWRSKLEMQKCNIQITSALTAPSSSVFSSCGNATGIHVADCLIEGQKNETDRKEELDSFGLVDRAVFSLDGAEYENCRFVSVDSCIAQAKKVSKCEFKKCEHVIDCSSLDDGASITNCLFSECEDVIRNLPPRSSVAYCQFCNCKNRLIRNVDSGCGGGISIKYCEFYNLIRDTDPDLFGSNACLHLVRSNKGDPSSVKNCIFDGINLVKGFLISGSVKNKKHIAVSVNDCEFRNCKTQESSGEIIETNHECLMAGIFGTLMTVRVIKTSNCLAACRAIKSYVNSDLNF
jgi:hypothetical protein